MSVNDIMNYVSKTPGNTNPAVIKSMVESENYGVLEKAQQMDEETLALAKAYADKKAEELAGSLSTKQVNALDALFKAASYIKDVSAEYAVFCEAFGLIGPDPQWVIGFAYSDGGYISVYGPARAIYVSEVGDHELEYTINSATKKYYPMELGVSKSVIVTCPTNMRPAIAALALSDGKWKEVGISGWMPQGGGKYSIPNGATHYFCVIKKTNESAFEQADFENVVVSSTEPDAPYRAFTILLHRLVDKLTNNTASISANENPTRMMICASVANNRRFCYYDGYWRDNSPYSPVLIPKRAVSAVYSIPNGMKLGMAFLGESQI
jgi:hypothetical protein